MLPLRSGILAEAINTKILKKNHHDSPLPTLISRIPCIPKISIPIPRIPTLIPRIPTLISCVPTLIPRVPTLIPRVSIIPLIPFADYLFRLLQITLTTTIRFFKSGDILNLYQSSATVANITNKKT